MLVPCQAYPIARDRLLRARRLDARRQPGGIGPQSCSIGTALKCAAEGAALIIGPCDPLGLPEDLPVCIPAAAGYVSDCKDCLEGAAKTVICEAVSLAEKLGIPVPSVLKSLC